MNILLTGAAGYIGRRLKDRLMGRPDVRLRLLVRNARKLRGALPPVQDIVEGDTWDRSALRRAMDGVDVAYDLIHSMGEGRGFEHRDRSSAQNFREAALEGGVKRCS